MAWVTSGHPMALILKGQSTAAESRIYTAAAVSERETNRRLSVLCHSPLLLAVPMVTVSRFCGYPSPKVGPLFPGIRRRVVADHEDGGLPQEQGMRDSVVQWLDRLLCPARN